MRGAGAARRSRPCAPVGSRPLQGAAPSRASPAVIARWRTQPSTSPTMDLVVGAEVAFQICTGVPAGGPVAIGAGSSRPAGAGAAVVGPVAAPAVDATRVHRLVGVSEPIPAQSLPPSGPSAHTVHTAVTSSRRRGPPAPRPHGPGQSPLCVGPRTGNPGTVGSGTVGHRRSLRRFPPSNVAGRVGPNPVTTDLTNGLV